MCAAQATVDPSWYDAPPLLQIAASQQGGSRGAQLWGVTKDYTLISIYQLTPGGSWSGWSSGNWLGAPPQVVQITAAQQNNGCVQFWATDQKQQLWSIAQTSPGGDWSSWSGPNWNGAPILTEIGAVEQGGTRGAQLWGITVSNQLISTFEETPGAGWSSWSTGSWLNAPPVIGVTAAGQNDGRVQIWVLDIKQQLWSAWQTSPGGDWTGWSGPNWAGAPPLQQIAAVQQGGQRGAQLWGVDENNALWTIYQVSPGGGWSSWIGPGWDGSPQCVQITGAQQNNGSVQFWAVDMNLALKSIAQTSPGGNWTAWAP